MSEAGTLFLGGPWHGRRMHVPEDTWIHVPLIAPVAWAAELDEFVEPGQVTYTCRRAPWSAERVFVAPDYNYDTPEWQQFDTEAWVRRVRPDVTGWEWLGDWFWRGRPPEAATRFCWLYILGDRQGRGYVCQLVTDEVVESSRFNVTDFVRQELQREIDYQLLPECVVPECDKKAPVVYRVAEPGGRLAGQDWRYGDEIRLCPEHSYDVLRAQGVYGLDKLVAWLQPDAKLDLLDAHDAGTDLLSGREIERSRARMLRLVEQGD